MSEQPMYTYTDPSGDTGERSCPAFTAHPRHPSDALYCEHGGGAGHTGRHYADTWSWADAVESGDTRVADVHVATPEGITPCGAGIHDVTTTARIADATCLECLSTLAQAEPAGRGDEGSTAPRDSDLIQAVRALVKRYGAPAVAYEAARQARHE